MKKIMTLVSAIMVCGLSFASEPATETFSGVNVNMPATVRFVHGDSYGLSVRSRDAYSASAVKWNVKDGVLSISASANDLSGVCITITSPTEPTLTTGRAMEISGK